MVEPTGLPHLPRYQDSSSHLGYSLHSSLELYVICLDRRRESHLAEKLDESRTV
jgi:hypothetical protein